MPYAAAAISRPSGTATSRRIASRASSIEILHLPASEGAGFQIAKDQIGVGDRRSGAPRSEARRTGDSSSAFWADLEQTARVNPCKRAATGADFGEVRRPECEPGIRRPSTLPAGTPPTRKSRMTLGWPVSDKAGLRGGSPISKEIRSSFRSCARDRTRRSRRQRVPTRSRRPQFGNRPRVVMPPFRLHH